MDGIYQPTIQDGPELGLADGREPCELWLFVLSYDAPNYYLPDPPELGPNGSFAVFKVMRQDVAGFEEFLQPHDRDGRVRIEAVRRQLEPRRHPVTACGPALARSLRLACHDTRRAGQPCGWPAARRLPAIGAWPRIERV